MSLSGAKERALVLFPDFPLLAPGYCATAFGLVLREGTLVYGPLADLDVHDVLSPALI